ncbi:MAG: phosphonate C-P lyase system protein PhnG [Alphaproteobacteria bacterium]|nr:phosphonate C-P lyase system protein PhnG [Alphaproteobacteria bacterium]MCW5738715.1 phosphonate C-P lyase system protein PhnG [Alphaproteobacteria bacterium]
MEKIDARRSWLAVLARAERTKLEEALSGLSPRPRWRVVKPAESGLAMVRGRAGGAGQQFNIGEMSVARCVVQVEGGAVGVGYVAGRDRRKAELVAVLDALLQDGPFVERLKRDVIVPLADRQEASRRQVLSKAAATKVDFFTMVRGS